MRIAILTLPLHKNYGGILQAYALQTVLERMGHETMVITKDRDVHVELIQLVIQSIKHWGRKLFRREDTFQYPWIINKERREREQFTKAFIDKYVHTYQIASLKKEFPNNMDAVVVGSDQVWRKMYFEGMYGCGIENAYLTFLEKRKIKRIAYAASFGTDEWEYSEDETKVCAKFLDLFEAVGVRESSAVTLCREKLGFDKVLHVLDPTFLLEREDYIQLVEQSNVSESPGNMMCYLLDMNEEIEKFIAHIAKERHLTPFMANSKVENPTAPQSERIQPPVEKWLRGFMDAEFVVTDSFHACVFSIIFGKPFVVLGNNKRGQARFTSLLSMFDLGCHLISKIDDYHSNESYSISEESMNLLRKRKSESMGFLIGALK